MDNVLCKINAVLEVTVEAANLWAISGNGYFSQNDSPAAWEELQNIDKFDSWDSEKIKVQVNGFYSVPEWMLETDPEIEDKVLWSTGYDDFLALLDWEIRPGDGIQYASIKNPFELFLVELEIEPAGEDVVLRMAGYDELFGADGQPNFENKEPVVQDSYITEPAIFVSAGGSHRAYQKDIRALDGAGIPFKDTGNLTLGSKKRALLIPTRLVEQARGLGLSVAKDQGKIEHSITYKTQENVTVETEVKVEFVVSESQDVHSIAAELASLREEQDRLGMKAAGLFAQVKNDKSYKAEFGTFANFCDATGWHRSTVYQLVAIFENPMLQAAYDELGQLKTMKLNKSGLQGAELADMIEFAKEHTAAELDKEIKASKPAADPVDKPETLEEKLERQSKLLARKAELEEELQHVISELAELTREVMAAAA